MSKTEVQELLNWVKAQPLPVEPVALCPGSTVIDMAKLIRITEARLLGFTPPGQSIKDPTQHPTYKVYLYRLQLIKAALC